MSRVLLLDPTIPGVLNQRPPAWVPLGLAYLAAVLREAGHEVRLQNRLADQLRGQLSLANLDNLTRDLIRRVQPDMVGISGVTASYGEIAALARLAREECPDATVVLGGPHATAAPRPTLERLPEAACLVVGEGERQVVELAGGQPPSSLRGVLWRDADGSVRENPWEPPAWDLDTLPLPARDLLPLDWYIRHSRSGIRGSYLRNVSLLSSRGCRYRCAFCSEPAYTVRGVRAHAPAHTVAEAESLLDAYPAPLVVFMDEMFTSLRDRALELVELWCQHGLHERVRFAVQARSDALDHELVTALKRAGCYHIELGVESGSDRILELMRKGLTVAQNREAVRLVQAAGIRVQMNIILGTPSETEEELRASLALVEELHPDAASIVALLPLPGTAFVRQLVAEGRLAEDFWAVEDREGPRPRANFSAMPDARYAELGLQARALSRRINAASRNQEAPLWVRLAGGAKRGVRRLLGRP
jgi:radical SAM superfamily enzyme YgiQ (UPF0313 family)